MAVAIVALGVALYFQIKGAHQQAGEQEELLKAYQIRVDEQEKLLKDYRSLEENFDNVGQGYEQALLAFDKLEEDKKKLEDTINTLRNSNQSIQQQYQQLSDSLLRKKEQIEKSAFEAKRQLTANPVIACRQLNTILNANEVGAETAIESDDNVTVGQIIEQAVLESGIGAVNYLSYQQEVSSDIYSMMLLTNESQAVRVLVALLDNAVKFTSEGTVKLVVRTDVSALRFIVEDTGSGIPAEDAEKIFEPFTKLNNFFDGAGLGLTAARSIARRMGGDVVLDTSYAAGARFVYTLPE